MNNNKQTKLGYFLIIFGLIFLFPSLSAQENKKLDTFVTLNDTIAPEVLDSLMHETSKLIEFTEEEAISYISSWYNNKAIWNNPDDPLRRSMGRFLYEATNDQFYVSEWYIDGFEWEDIKIPSSSFYVWDTLNIVLDRKVDTVLEVYKTEPVIQLRDSSEKIIADTIQALPQKQLTLIDTFTIIKSDSIILVLSDTLNEVISSNQKFPFHFYNYPQTGDSIEVAMDVLKNYSLTRDSTKVVFVGSEDTMPVWLSNNPNRMMRLRLKNEWDEELSIWIGSPSRDSVSVIVEKGVHFRRPNKETRFADARIDVQTVDNSKLADPQKIDFTPQYWSFLSEASFVFNQALIKNWAKGGESNISMMIDLLGTANYTNKDQGMIWNSVGRFKYGLQMSGEYGVRKNIDLIDISSKFTNKAFGKFDFSAMLIFKTQLAKGYKYPNDSVVVSKFFNPADLTLGLGLDYKPNKNTSINFAPLSYKATFVPDTASIDQTKHGLRIDQRSKHEPGMSIQIDHKMLLWKKVTVTNKVRLFTNYIDDPLNIDIDWEMIATAKLNWYTDIRLNTHFIYDDDTLIPIYDKENEPVLGSDGKQKKGPRVQFKEVIGLSIIFRF